MKTNTFRRVCFARVAAALACLSVALGLSSARAAPEGANQRVVLREFHGPQAARLKDAIEGALLMRYSLVPDSMVMEAARRSGGRLLTDQDYAAVAKSLNVQAFVSATVHRQQDWRIEMVVRKGDTGQTVARYDWSGHRIDALAASVARRTPSRLRVLLAGNFAVKLAPPDETVQAHAEASPAAADEPRPSAPGARDRPFLEVSVGSRVFSRSMSFAQNVSGLPGYQLAHGTGITAEMALHPFAASGATAGGWAAGIGFYGTVNLAIGLDTQDATGASARTDAYGYEAGVRYRIIAGAFDLSPASRTWSTTSPSRATRHPACTTRCCAPGLAREPHCRPASRCGRRSTTSTFCRRAR